jgi:hypothetical protein
LQNHHREDSKSIPPDEKEEILIDLEELTDNFVYFITQPKETKCQQVNNTSYR